MGSIYFSIGAGIVTFVISLWLINLIFRIRKINPLMGLGTYYIFWHYLTEKLMYIVPESWKTQKIDNPFELQGFLGHVLNLQQHQFSTYTLAITVFRLCFMCYFVYTLSIKKRIWDKLKQENTDSEHP